MKNGGASLLVVGLVACGGAEKPPPLGRMATADAPAVGDPVAPPPPSTQTAAVPATATATAEPAKLAAVDGKIVTLRISGPEPRLLAPPIRAALAGLKSCFEKLSPAPRQRWLDLSISVDPTGAVSGIRTKGELATSVQGCAEAALGSSVFEPRKGRPPVTIDAGIRFTLVDDSKRPALGEKESLFRAPDGTCLALEVFDCPANKVCAAPKEKPVLCPTELGLPPLAQPGNADRRVDIAIRGGKADDPSERIVFSRVAERCSVLKVVGEPEALGNPRAEVDAQAQNQELVDAPCADFDAVWSLAQAKFGGVQPPAKAQAPGKQNPELAVTLWQMGRDSIPVVSEVRWSAKSKLDAAFNDLTKLCGPVATKRGTRLRLKRLTGE